MEQIFNLVRQFALMPHNVGHVNYITCFIEVMNAILELVQETLLDARDVHDRETFYTRIYEAIGNLRRLLTAYSNSIDVTESDGESESDMEDEGIILNERNRQNRNRQNMNRRNINRRNIEF